MFFKKLKEKIINNKGTISINGKSYHGNSLSMKNGTVIIDGKKVDSDDKNINIVIEKSILTLTVDYCESIEVRGDVGKLSTTSGDVEVMGDVHGNISTTSGDIECGDVDGDIKTTSGNVKAKNIKGAVSTLSGNIR
jgi:formylmethanofuran dehydrogenase subunit C